MVMLNVKSNIKIKQQHHKKRKKRKKLTGKRTEETAIDFKLQTFFSPF